MKNVLVLLVSAMFSCAAVGCGSENAANNVENAKGIIVGSVYNASANGTYYVSTGHYDATAGTNPPASYLMVVSGTLKNLRFYHGSSGTVTVSIVNPYYSTQPVTWQSLTCTKTGVASNCYSAGGGAVIVNEFTPFVFKVETGPDLIGSNNTISVSLEVY